MGHPIPSRPTVLLFDVDGTLVSTAGAGRRAIERTFAEIYGREDACRSFRFDGMTDLGIMRLALKALGLEPTAEAAQEIFRVYVTVLEDEVRRADRDRYRVHRGIREAIARSHELGLGVGLGTGNIREGARLKLERVSLFDQFAFGGFGNDSEDRVELIRLGADRGAALLGLPRSECRVVIIGDTPKDVAAARAIGAESVGVGTGSFSPADLLQSGATYAFADLGAPGALEALTLGTSAG
ncbi:MAG: haloacid dehalogenase-like hydrolase [Polyangiaceae bacterium]|nr:haloacid dehalogenase-like hydrolase [Polyangiaceae bacterium]